MSNSLKRILKIIAWGIGVFLALGTISYFVLDKKMPVGKEGPEAEALADKMLAAINKPAWDTLGAIHWDYSRGHSFTWDKRNDLAEIVWGKKRVLVDPKSGKGIAYENGKQVNEKKNENLVKDGLKFFWNDGFWLYAPFKCKDPGTVRKLVEGEDGEKSLMVTYSSGGLTPGDTYLWHLDDSGKPKSWQFWVKILPIGGLGSTWEHWETLPGGAMLATWRGTSLVDMAVTNLKGGQSLTEIGYPEDLFAPLK